MRGYNQPAKKHTMKTEPNVPQHLLSRRQLAMRWQVSIETLKRREIEGGLPCLKIGSRVRYRISDVEAIELQAAVSR